MEVQPDVDPKDPQMPKAQKSEEKWEVGFTKKKWLLGLMDLGHFGFRREHNRPRIYILFCRSTEASWSRLAHSHGERSSAKLRSTSKVLKQDLRATTQEGRHSDTPESPHLAL